MARCAALLAAAALVAGAAVTSAAPAPPKELGSFSITNPGFCALTTPSGASGPSLTITQFTGNPFAHDSVSFVDGIGKMMSNPSSIAPTKLTTNVTWPNEPNPVPALGGSPFPGMGVGTGFLVPGKSNGFVSLVATDGPNQGQVYHLSAPKSGWFYHRVLWKDMNGDGRLDVITARATKPIFGNAAGELLWFEQPASNPLEPVNMPWKEHSLVTGNMAPDVFFRLHDMTGDGHEDVVYTSFFTGGGLAYITAPGGDWSDPSKFTMVTIDTSEGPMFAVELADLNNDGKVDILATNNGASAGKQNIVAYEFPTTAGGTWRKHALAVGFMPSGMGIGKGAPGAPFAFYANSKTTTGKPLIGLSGDDDGHAYILSANSTDPTDWAYTLTSIMDCQGTCGSIAYGDADGDGGTDLFVPCYDKNTVHVFSYSA